MNVYTPDLSIGHLFRQSWPRFKHNLWMLLGAFTVYILILGILSDPNPSDEQRGGLLSLVGFVLTGPLSVGLYGLNLAVQRDEPVDFGELFSGFREFGRAFGVYALAGIATVIGLLFLIVPGIIIAVGLWPSLYLVSEHELGVVDTLKEAWAMTSGHRPRLFLLGVVLFFFTICGLIALGIGILFTGALSVLVAAAAYEELALAWA